MELWSLQAVSKRNNSGPSPPSLFLCCFGPEHVAPTAPEYNRRSRSGSIDVNLWGHHHVDVLSVDFVVQASSNSVVFTLHFMDKFPEYVLAKRPLSPSRSEDPKLRRLVSLAVGSAPWRVVSDDSRPRATSTWLVGREGVVSTRNQKLDPSVVKAVVKDAALCQESSHREVMSKPVIRPSHCTRMESTLSAVNSEVSVALLEDAGSSNAGTSDATLVAFVEAAESRLHDLNLNLRIVDLLRKFSGDV